MAIEIHWGVPSAILRHQAAELRWWPAEVEESGKEYRLERVPGWETNK